MKCNASFDAGKDRRGTARRTENSRFLMRAGVGGTWRLAFVFVGGVSRSVGQMRDAATRLRHRTRPRPTLQFQSMSAIFPAGHFLFLATFFATFSHGTAVGSRFFPFLKKEHCEEFDVLSESVDGFVIRVEDRPESAAVSVGGLVLADGAPSSVAVRHHPTLVIISRGMKIAVTYLDMFQ